MTEANEASRKQHWEAVHEGKGPDERSWFQPKPEVSLELFDAAGVQPSARVLDVGGGTSRLVDCLVERGFEAVSVLDIAGRALEEARERLGERAGNVAWIEGDITEVQLEGPFDVWHDRAVFHFLTQPQQRAHYRQQLLHTLQRGGYVVIATFAEDGPTRCSGLPVVRYSAEALGEELGTEQFERVATRREPHQTPGGKVQQFVYGLFRRR